MVIPIAITRDTQIALYNHTADINRAADDYAAHPNRACHAHGCFELADEDRLCREHRRLRNEAAARMRQHRKKEQK